MDTQQAFPKPLKRHKDPKAIAAYRARVRRCECGCRSNRSLEVHHIISRKMGGGDVDENFLVLTAREHGLWHTVGGHEFFRRHETNMGDEAAEKVRRALRIAT